MTLLEAHFLLPDNAVSEGIDLSEGYHIGLYDWLIERHSGFLDPDPAPLGHVEAGLLFEFGDQAVPRRVTVTIVLQVTPQAFPEGFGPHFPGQKVHCHRRFVVDDIAVDQPGVAEVVERTLDGVGADGTVFRIGRRIVRFEVSQPVIDTGKYGPHDLRGKPVRKDLFGPYVVEPFHRNVVAEPHVRRFVGDQLSPVEQFGRRGLRSEKDAPVVVERGPGMLHAAILEIGQHDKIVFGEGIGDSGIVLHIIERIEDEAEDGGLLGQFRGIRLAVVHRYGPAVFRGHIALKTACYEGEEIGAQRLGFRKSDAASAVCGRAFFSDGRIGNGHPVFGYGKRQRIAGFQVGLVEAREERPRPVGHEQRIEEFFPLIERLFAGKEGDLDAVFACDRKFLRNYNMLVYNAYRYVISINA